MTARHAEPAPERGTSSNQKRLEEIALRLKALNSKPPWKSKRDKWGQLTVVALNKDVVCDVPESAGSGKADAALIANAPSDLEWCIDYIRELEGRLGALAPGLAASPGENVPLTLHISHLRPLLEVVRAAKCARVQREYGMTVRFHEPSEHGQWREIEYRLEGALRDAKHRSEATAPNVTPKEQV